MNLTDPERSWGDLILIIGALSAIGSLVLNLIDVFL